MNKYPIQSFDAWVWKIAHNRYARFIDSRNKNQVVLSGEDELFDAVDCSGEETEFLEQQHETVFRYLHTLSSKYRNLFVDYYIGELSIRSLAEKYSLPETTVKWRLNEGRQKIRDRIGEHKMEKIYQRINWNTTLCNGNLNPDAYLHTQTARAICLAAYEKPLTVEEISLCTGLPTMYIEDELPRLEHGEAICRTGSKYAANFILFRKDDRKRTEAVSRPILTAIADKLEHLLTDAKDRIPAIGFYGCDFGMERLGYILVPYLLRTKLRAVKDDRLHLENGPYPIRKDGGYGWYIVEETADETENCPYASSGCNVAGDDSGSRNEIPSHLYYYWISKYFDADVYHNRGTRWLCAKGIPQKAENGVLPDGLISEEDTAHLLRTGLVRKADERYALNFACFTGEQFNAFSALFDMNDDKIDDLLAEWIRTVRRNFENFVPARLHDQINPFVSCYLNELIGCTVEELIARGILRSPVPGKPLADGVFCVAGSYIHP